MAISDSGRVAARAETIARKIKSPWQKSELIRYLQKRRQSRSLWLVRQGLVNRENINGQKLEPMISISSIDDVLPKKYNRKVLEAIVIVTSMTRGDQNE